MFGKLLSLTWIIHDLLFLPLKKKSSIIGGSVAKAVKSRARCTTLEAARASETKFALYFFPFFARVFTIFLFKLSYVQLWYSLALRVLVSIVGSFFERVFSHLRLFHTYLFRLYATCIVSLDLSSKFRGVAKAHVYHCDT